MEIIIAVLYFVGTSLTMLLLAVATAAHNNIKEKDDA